MTNRELEKRYYDLKRSWENIINANIELVDNIKEKDKEIERLNTDKEQLTSLVNSCQEEIRKLRNQLQQKENIIKEVREYSGELRLYDNESIEFEISNDLLKILDKGE